MLKEIVRLTRSPSEGNIVESFVMERLQSRGAVA